MRKLGLIAIAVIIAAAAAWYFAVRQPAMEAQMAASDAAATVKARQENRKAVTDLGREMRRTIESNGDLTALATQAARSAELTKDFGTMFPPGSDGGDTLAAPAIWTDRAGFDAINKASIDAVSKLAELAKSGDRAALMDQYRAYGRTCGECHRAYSKSDPFKK